jgi:hypothetical protein
MTQVQDASIRYEERGRWFGPKQLDHLGNFIVHKKVNKDKDSSKKDNDSNNNKDKGKDSGDKDSKNNKKDKGKDSKDKQQRQQ